MTKKSNSTFSDPRKRIAPPSPCADPKHTMIGISTKKKKGMGQTHFQSGSGIPL
jgi:hypothetical protein